MMMPQMAATHPRWPFFATLSICGLPRPVPCSRLNGLPGRHHPDRSIASRGIPAEDAAVGDRPRFLRRLLYKSLGSRTVGAIFRFRPGRIRILYSVVATEAAHVRANQPLLSVAAVPASPEVLRDRPVRFAVVGTGGRVGTTRAQRRRCRCRSSRLVDIEPRAQALAAEIGGKPTPSMEEAFASDDVDVLDSTGLPAQGCDHPRCEA